MMTVQSTAEIMRSRFMVAGIPRVRSFLAAIITRIPCFARTSAGTEGVWRDEAIDDRWDGITKAPSQPEFRSRSPARAGS